MSDELWDDIESNLGHIAEIEAENAKLRATLTQIMELGYHSLDPDVDKRMTELAREALSS